jgi:hypothetical protein
VTAGTTASVALLGIAEDLVRRGDELELLLVRRVGIDVGVQLARKATVGLLDVILTGVAPNFQDLIIVTFNHILYYKNFPPL